jgi:hypothetical protein
VPPGDVARAMARLLMLARRPDTPARMMG